MKYQKIGVLATHGDGEAPKTLDAGYVKNIMYYFDNLEKRPFNYVMETRWMNVSTLGIIAGQKKGNYYGIKFICCIGMHGNYA